jgi:predicted CopG family antitoxin
MGREAFVYDSCMATKTISIEIDVYDRIVCLRTNPSESFSRVLRRELPEKRRTTAEDILRMIDAGTLPRIPLDFGRLEESQRDDLAPDDPWSE